MKTVQKNLLAILAPLMIFLSFGALLPFLSRSEGLSEGLILHNPEDDLALDSLAELGALLIKFPQPWLLSEITPTDSYSFTFNGDCSSLATPMLINIGDVDGDLIDDFRVNKNTVGAIMWGSTIDWRNSSLRSIPCTFFTDPPQGLQLMPPEYIYHDPYAGQKLLSEIVIALHQLEGRSDTKKPSLAMLAQYQQPFPGLSVYCHHTYLMTLDSLDTNIFISSLINTTDATRFDTKCDYNGNNLVTIETAGMAESVGDVNNDGYNDAIILTTLMQYFTVQTTGCSNPPCLYKKIQNGYFIYGGPSWPESSISSSQLNATLGCAISTTSGTYYGNWQKIIPVGDIDGDSHPDVIVIGATKSVASNAVVLFGGPTFCSTGKIILDINNMPLDTLLFSLDPSQTVYAAPDLNGDGANELFLSTPTANQNAGSVQIIYGGPGMRHGLSLHNGCRFEGETQGDFLGTTIFSLSDFNGRALPAFVLGGNIFCAAGNGCSGSPSLYIIFPDSDFQCANGAVVSLSYLNGQNGFKVLLDNGYASYSVIPFMDRTEEGRNSLIFFEKQNSIYSGLVIYGDTSPTVLTNQFMIDVHAHDLALSLANLYVTHPAMASSRLSFVLSNITHLSFYSKSDNTTALTKIPQDQIENYYYLYDGSGFSPSFLVSIDDGITKTSPFAANITFIPDKPPYIAHRMSDKTVTAGQPFQFLFPKSWVVDPDGDSLLFNATLTSSNSLPSFLLFDSETGKFSGIAPDASDKFEILIMGCDPFKQCASDKFSLFIKTAKEDQSIFAQLLEKQVVLAVIGAIVTGMVGLAFWRYKKYLTQNDTRVVSLFGDLLYRELRLPGCADFTSTTGQRFLQVSDTMRARLDSEFGERVEMFERGKLKLLVASLKKAIYRILDPTAATQNMCTKNIITIDGIEDNLDDILDQGKQAYEDELVAISQLKPSHHWFAFFSRATNNGYALVPNDLDQSAVDVIALPDLHSDIDEENLLLLDLPESAPEEDIRSNSPGS